MALAVGFLAVVGAVVGLVLSSMVLFIFFSFLDGSDIGMLEAMVVFSENFLNRYLVCFYSVLSSGGVFP